ncbi:hypothetical protein EG68_03306 [Paragonimus skrjabini miyazakii]|uniref:Serine hydroxymethyltransferase-like domain-containing protein n=1 Tax=Paragonimus skrjabini miyazakii TaxID=59628 RepID=A0A8S9Z8A5_9TREM|nr:hypothetical protein EG68_03306 [Paragonimus skrjabini miyazakii]
MPSLTEQHSKRTSGVIYGAFGEALSSYGICLVSGGTDVHFVLVDLARSSGKPGLGRGDGARVHLAADLAGITLNKNTAVGDKSAQQPSGLRLGTWKVRLTSM